MKLDRRVPSLLYLLHLKKPGRTPLWEIRGTRKKDDLDYVSVRKSTSFVAKSQVDRYETCEGL